MDFAATNTAATNTCILATLCITFYSEHLKHEPTQPVYTHGDTTPMHPLSELYAHIRMAAWTTWFHASVSHILLHMTGSPFISHGVLLHALNHQDLALWTHTHNMHSMLRKAIRRGRSPTPWLDQPLLNLDAHTSNTHTSTNSCTCNSTDSIPTPTSRPRTHDVVYS